MIDLHCHVLPGIDDGPKTIEGSVAIARAAAGAGTRILLATPHVSRRYDNRAAAIARLTEELNARLADEAIALKVRAGAEIAMTRLAELEAAELARLGLDGGGRWLLVEPPFSAVASALPGLVEDLQDRGHRVVLAHPERCHAFQREPRLLQVLVRGGAVTSITAGSLTGRFGETVRRFATQLAWDGLVHNVASDAHDVGERPPSILPELAQAGLGPLAHWLTDAVPAAILDGEETIPPRPDVDLPGLRAPRRWWRRAGRVTRAS